jgi:acetyl esterase/lipase
MTSTASSGSGVPATFSDVKYGPHDRNRFDIWFAQSSTPTPLVLYFHGGGFTSKDKSIIWGSPEIDAFLQAGTSFATVNYRFHEEAGGVLGSLGDCARALQVMRHLAPAWHIDKERIGAYGNSAGGGASLWLGFHTDMADPNSLDVYMHESTRLKAVGALSTQATYDIEKWAEIFPPNAWASIPATVRKEINAQAMIGYGFCLPPQIDSPEGKEIRAKIDMLNMMDRDAPPFYVLNDMRPRFHTWSHVTHSPHHARALRNRASVVGVLAEVFVYTPYLDDTGQARPRPVPPGEDHVSFLLRHLLEIP